MELPYDPAVPFLGIYLKKMGSDKKRYMPAVFTAALFTIAATRKQPKGLSNPVVFPALIGTQRPSCTCTFGVAYFAPLQLCL